MIVSSETTRDRILRAAARQFALFGFEGASLRAIAAEVGIKAASIFHHFPGGKRELYDAITDGLLVSVEARILETLGRGLEPAAAMMSFAASFWDLLAENPDLASLLLREAFEGASERNSEKRAQAGVFLEGLLETLSAAQSQGALPRFPPEALLMALASYGVVAHGAPVIRELLYARGERDEEMRAHFIALVRRLLELPAPA